MTNRTLQLILLLPILELLISSTNGEQVNSKNNQFPGRYTSKGQNRIEARNRQIEFCQSNGGSSDEIRKEFQITQVPKNKGVSEAFRMLTYITQDKNNSDHVSENITENGNWELDNIQMLKTKFLNLKEKFPNNKLALLDIGANLGWYSFLLAQIGVYTAAFEPLEANIYAMRKTMCLQPSFNEYIDLYEVGLGAERKTCSIYTYPQLMLNGVVICDLSQQPPQNFIKQGNIKINLLDDYIGDIPEDWIIGAMKIDIEGMEEFAFRGGIAFLKKYKIPYIQIEFEEKHLGIVGTYAYSTFEAISALGYEFHRFNYEGPVYDTVDSLFEQINFERHERDYYLTLKKENNSKEMSEKLEL